MLSLPPCNDRRWAVCESWFAAFAFVWFAYIFAKWTGAIGGEPMFRPLAMVLLAGAMLLNTLTSLAMRRSVRPGYAFLVANIVVLGVLVVTGAAR